MNFKRIVSLLLVVIFSVILMVYVFADDQKVIRNERKAQTLKALGLFKGSNIGFELDREPNRVESGVMFVRLLGKEKEAEEMKCAHPFTDVPGWADAYIGYMYEKGYTKGIGNNLYGSNDLIQVESYITFILRALGYSDSKGDFTWSDPFPKAGDIGLINTETEIALKEKVFLRDDLVGISYDALNVYLKDTDSSLIEKLIEENAISSETAIETGIITKPQWNGMTTVIFSNFDGGTHFISIDRSSLPENMRDFYKIVTGGLDNLDEGLFQLSILSNERSKIDVGHFNTNKPYDDENGMKTNYYPDMSIKLFDKDGNRLGAALLNPVKEGTVSVEFKEYKAEYPDDFEEVLKPFREMADVNAAVSYVADTRDKNNPTLYFYVDRTLLPQGVQSYSGYVTLSGGSNKPIEDTMYEMFKSGWVPKPSKAKEIYRIFDEIKGGTLLLFSSEGKMIGWAKLEENQKPSANGKLVELQVFAEDSGYNPTMEDLSIQRHINGSPDPLFNNDEVHMGIARFKETNGEIEKDWLILHIGPYLKLYDSIRYEVTSNKIKIVEVRTEEIQ